MAIEKVIKIVADIKNATKKLDEIDNKLNKTKKSNNGLISGFKTLGKAILATGIGAFVTAVTALGVAFSKNQRVMDAFNTVTETLGIILSQVATALINVYDSVSANSENFDALGRVLKGLLTLAVTPLKLAFFGIKLGIQEAQLAWEKSVFGGKDENKIKELTKSIEETNKNLRETGIDAIVAGKGIVDNFGEAITEVADIGGKAVDELGKISVKSAIETAKANVQIKNTAMLAVAEQGRLVEVYDRLAEKQRQIRDDESISIKDRIKANEELGKVLEKQEEALLKQANAQIASAQVELNKNNTIENQVALTEALANKEGVLAQIEGFRSEQLVNRIALQKEEIELTNTISDAEKERRLKQLEFEASQEENALAKLDKQRERLNLENEIILEDLERKRELFKEGTQARIDAEQEFLNRKQDIDNAIIENDRKKADEQIKLEESVQNAKKNIANQGLALIQEIAGRGSKIGKAIAVAQTIRSGIEGVQNAYSTAQKSPITIGFPAYPLVQAGLAGAFSALQVRQILATSDVGGTSPSGGQQGAQAPSFNLIQGTGSNQIANTITQEQKPVQAFVVGSNVNSQAELDRQRTANSSI